MANSVLHFTASTNVKNLFGRGLVTDQVAAVFELVKNSYDADANEVNIVFSGLDSDSPTITITDDGTGMDLNDIKTRWMVIGTDSKKGIDFSPIYHRPLNGDKGIGRFSVDRLGSVLTMKSQKRNTTEEYSVHFDWSLFDLESKNISDIDIPFEIKSISKNNNGVSLSIQGLRDTWNENKIKELYRNLRQLKSPFSQEDNFRMYITAKEYGYDKKEIIVEQLETISSLWVDANITESDPSTIQISVNKDGVSYKSAIQNTFSFGSVKAQVYMFNQGDKIRFSNRYGLLVRNYGNIRLYRDNFRVYPYGEATNDWLDIDRRQTQGLLRFFGTRDLIGFIQISKTGNPELKPLTNRQGLEENEFYFQLKKFVVEICIKTLESYYFKKIKKGENETPKIVKAEMGDALQGINKIASEIKTTNPDTAKKLSGFVSSIKQQQKKQDQYVKDQQEIVKVYSRIAQKETFLHKIIHQSMIHVKDATTALNTYMETVEKNDSLVSIQELMDDALSLLVTVRDDVVKKREKSYQNVSSLVQKYLDQNNESFEKNGIKTSFSAEGDLNYYVDEGDIKAIVNNLTSNAVKSLLKISDRQRTISFNLYKTDKFIIIRCTDNGIGIPESERERIFDPFQSTTGGFGLGLTIIDEICKEYGGALELIETDIGACFSVKLRS